jgi:aminopeptidase YwaD
MPLDWNALDRWIMGEAWVGAQIDRHLARLCDEIGPRWASSPQEWETVNYLREQLEAYGLADVSLEEFSLQSWAWEEPDARLAQATIGGEARPISFLPFHRCPSFELDAPLVDVGFGTAREIEACGTRLRGATAVAATGLEPFTVPTPLAYRLAALAEAGAALAVVVDRKEGGRKEYHTATDWINPGLDENPLPCVTVSREDGARLRKAAAQGKPLQIAVASRFYTAPAHNVSATLTGARWPAEHLVLGGHHDTVRDAPGGNDNASGVIVALETARVLSQLQRELGVRPGCTLRFVTYSAEEQKLQGSEAYVQRHYGDGRKPRLAINLDELATGPMKGLVLAFPHLRELVQAQFDAMGDGLKCHVMGQLDPTSDHFSFLRQGIDAAFCWRWRFVGRHPDSDFHHEPGDTADKVRPRELKEYIGHLARLLLRLSHVEPDQWPANELTPDDIAARLDDQRGQIVRIF